MVTRTQVAAVLGVVIVAGLGLLGVGSLVEVGSQQSADAHDRPVRGDGGSSLTAAGRGSGAGGGGVDFDGERRTAERDSVRATSTPAPPKDQASTDENDPVLDARDRARIKTGRLTIQVADFASSQRTLAQRTRQYGGYVSDVSRRSHREGNRTWTTGEVTLRVPAENFSRLRQAANGSGLLLREDVSTRDVTEQLVDLNARIENLQRQRDRLRTMYDRANETEELLAIQDQLSDVQGQIERLEARRTALRRQVSYSTLTVELREPEPGSPTIDPPAYHERPLVDAFVSSVNGVVVLARSAVVTLAYALPYLLVVSLIALPAWVWRRRRRRDIRP